MKQTIKVKCKFAKDEDVLNIFRHSFYLYLKRVLTERNGYAD